MEIIQITTLLKLARILKRESWRPEETPNFSEKLRRNEILIIQEMNRASVFEWHKRFKEGRESVRDDERCARSKEVNTPELTGQRVRVRVRVTMLMF